MALAQIGQDDFAVGVLRGVAPDVQPGIGLNNALNGLLDDDGDVYRRGGDLYYSAAPAGANPLTFIWTGFLSNQPKALLADRTGLFTLSGAKVLVPIPGGLPLLAPILPAITSNLVYLPNGSYWGGSTKATYNTGTITSTAGSKTITGVGTTWTANVEPGMIVTIGGLPHVLVAVTDNTHIVLDRAPTPVAAGVAYSIASAGTWTRPASLLAVGTLHLAAVAGRLIVACGNRIAMSEPEKPWSFLADDFHDLPQGVIVQGLAASRDTLLIFTNYGLWTATNLSFNLTDAAGNIQQVLGVLAPEISLWHESGLAEWSGRWIAPCIDRVYMVDAISQPVSISDSITPLYMQYVRGGFRAGGSKVFRNTFFLPILAQDATPQTMLTCRLNRPVRGRLLYYPWTTFDGHASKITCADVALIDATPKFLASHSDGRVTALTDVFAPSAANAKDADNTTHVFDVETRDYPTGTGQPNHVRKLRLRYTLQNIADTKAQILAGISYGTQAQTYETVRTRHADYAAVKAYYVSYDELFRGKGLASGLPSSSDDPLRYWAALPPQTLPEPGVNPAMWRLTRAARVRYVRARFRITDPVAKFTVHHLDLSVRPATHDR